MSDVSDREKFEFEREKWRADFDVRQREIALKEKDAAASRWRSPIVVAIFAASAAAIGNAVVAYVNGSQQLALENGKSESARILEMIKTGDAEKAGQNLEFLLKAGLIGDSERVNKLTVFLADHPHGTGPALPSPSGPVAFEPSAALTDSMKQSLDKLLQDYIARLDRLGLPAPERVSIKVQQTGSSPNAYYDSSGKFLVIDPKLTGDRSVPLHTYNHHILKSDDKRAWAGHYAALESGLADYLACSHLDNPKVGEITAKILTPGRPYLRNMDNNLSFANVSAVPETLQGGEIWGGAFWALRSLLGRDPVDAILIAAWRGAKWPDDENQIVPTFLATLLMEVAQKAPAQRDAARAVLKARGFPVAD